MSHGGASAVGELVFAEVQDRVRIVAIGNFPALKLRDPGEEERGHGCINATIMN